jgi:hypothetical protein
MPAFFNFYSLSGHQLDYRRSKIRAAIIYSDNLSNTRELDTYYRFLILMDTDHLLGRCKYGQKGCSSIKVLQTQRRLLYLFSLFSSPYWLFWINPTTEMLTWVVGELL